MKTLIILAALLVSACGTPVIRVIVSDAPHQSESS